MRRYSELRFKVAGIVYLADNDQVGRLKAEKCAEAAAAVGLPFVVVYAGDVLEGLPAGGSIDDVEDVGAAIELILKQAEALGDALSQHEEPAGQAEGREQKPVSELQLDELAESIIQKEGLRQFVSWDPGDVIEKSLSEGFHSYLTIEGMDGRGGGTYVELPKILSCLESYLKFDGVLGEIVEQALHSRVVVGVDDVKKLACWTLGPWSVKVGQKKVIIRTLQVCKSSMDPFPALQIMMTL